jgi:site-specific recombinase XerC
VDHLEWLLDREWSWLRHLGPGHHAKYVPRHLGHRVVESSRTTGACGMTSENTLLPPIRSAAELVALPDTAAVLAAWRTGKSPRTLAAYAEDLADYAHWCGNTVDAATAQLLGCDAGTAHRLALGYLDACRARGLASATCARRLAALRSLTHAARIIGVITWTLELPSQKVIPYRDTRGPGRAGFLRLVAVAGEQKEPKRSRDLAILWLAYGRALRRTEICSLRFPEDLDLPGECIQVLGKHRTQREWLTIPPATCRALQAWLVLRGNAPGSLIYRLDRATPRDLDRQPLTGEALYQLLASLSVKAGLGQVRPHGLRHAAITDVLDVTRGDFRSAQRFGRLAKADTLRHYDDNREDLGGTAGRLIAP